MDSLRYNEFIFSSKYRLLRHAVFWLVLDFLNALYLWSTLQYSFDRLLIQNLLWTPVRMLYTYPLMYWVVPRYLLKGKHIQFIFIILSWGAFGWLLNYLFRLYFFIPFEVAMGYKEIVFGARQPLSVMILIASAAGAVTIKLFKHWLLKQRQWLQAEKEKVTAELQLLKAQVHPHFLFNTLNNIYSFSLENSPKTPELILKLSSLLSYMLYDCKADEVLLEKEMEIMKNYVDLEKERYGNRLEISWNVEGEVKDQYVAPLLLLPFLENAFKHGTSDQLEKPWLSFDLSVAKDTMKCKIVNSKNEFIGVSNKGIGIENVKKRLALIYPGKHELKMNDEGIFFVVSLWINLKNPPVAGKLTSPVMLNKAENTLV